MVEEEELEGGLGVALLVAVVVHMILFYDCGFSIIFRCRLALLETGSSDETPQ